jgi:hypothetical protein
MISYSTNWMGPINLSWFRDRGYTKIVDKVLIKDSIVTNQKKGDTVQFEEITTNFAGGRIDVYGTDEPYGYEIGLPSMRVEDFNNFSDWLKTYKTETVKTLDEIVTEYEKTNSKIRWSK